MQICVYMYEYAYVSCVRKSVSTLPMQYQQEHEKYNSETDPQSLDHVSEKKRTQ